MQKTVTNLLVSLFMLFTLTASTVVPKQVEGTKVEVQVVKDLERDSVNRIDNPVLNLTKEAQAEEIEFWKEVEKNVFQEEESENLSILRRPTPCYENWEIVGYLEKGEEVTFIRELTQPPENKYVLPYVEVGVEKHWFPETCVIDSVAFDEPRAYSETVLNRVSQWWNLAKKVGEEYDIDPMILMGVLGKESHGNPKLVSSDGWYSVGLMQIIRGADGCRAWKNLGDSVKNVECGAVILNDIHSQVLIMMEDGYEPPNGYVIEDAWRTTLAAYNCGFQSLFGENGKRCTDAGGLTYADEILNVWIPMLEEYMTRVGRIES